MKISENEVASVEPFGMLNGKQVNLVKLRGGLNLATTVGKNGGEDVLGAASHQAILCYTIEQRHPEFQPMLMKSEHESVHAESHSHFLTDDLRNSGHDIYSVQNGASVDFFVTKQNIKVGLVKATFENSALLIKSMDASKEFVACLSGAVSEKALSSGMKIVRMK